MSYLVSARCNPLQMPGVAKSVLMHLSDMCNDSGHCWPSIDTLVVRSCWKRTAVINALSWLEASGVLRADRSNGRKTFYCIQPDRFSAADADAWVRAGRPSVAGVDGANQSARRTGTRDGPVRETDGTGTRGGLNQSAKRTLTIRNHQEPEKTPQPPAEAGGADGLDAASRKAGSTTTVTRLPERPADAGFAAFWQAYPRKSAESRARRQWVRLRPDEALVGVIVAAVREQCTSAAWQREEGRFVPMASAWLHGERWRDVVGQPPEVVVVPADWRESSEGVRAMGARLGMLFSLDSLGTAYTDDQRIAHWRKYRSSVIAAAEAAESGQQEFQECQIPAIKRAA